MINKQRWFVAVAMAACVLAASIWAVANNAGSGKSHSTIDLEKLNGIWILADSDNPVWFSLAAHSTLTIRDGTFSISRFCKTDDSRCGTFTLDPTSTPKAVDIEVGPIDLPETFGGGSAPAFDAAGIYKLDGDRLSICYSVRSKSASKSSRPANFAPTERLDTMMASFVRAPDGFHDFPTEVTVRVSDPSGKPVAGASLFRLMSLQGYSKAKNSWQNIGEFATTNQDGIVQAAYDKLGGQKTIVRDNKRGLVGFLPLSPAAVFEQPMRVTLQHECNIHGKLQWKAAKIAATPIGWTICNLDYKGQTIATCQTPPGSEYEFHVPAGNYELGVRGGRIEHASTQLTVPEGRSDYAAPPILLNMSKLAMLEGQPAPELAGVVDWRGMPVKLADLKGKYVLLDFWGYWCGPCVAKIPDLIDLHERFKDRGLAIIGVHVGDVDTVAKLDEKLVPIREKMWHGKDIPFPVAITLFDFERETPSPVRDYGIEAFPTLVLIDREGKVVGQYSLPHGNFSEIEKLLKK